MGPEKPSLRKYSQLLFDDVVLWWIKRRGSKVDCIKHGWGKPCTLQTKPFVWEFGICMVVIINVCLDWSLVLPLEWIIFWSWILLPLCPILWMVLFFRFFCVCAMAFHIRTYVLFIHFMPQFVLKLHAVCTMQPADSWICMTPPPIWRRDFKKMNLHTLHYHIL